ncbi:hypothetical protein BJ875DRAFT_439081 [Amylocarpus encephaloides]|uniref:Uncharacterized protein n=1 Tax=Amylocarpus encephaloides TaxID=45428 RepID=A0A9P7YP01_9HELO|nr:hypothetical protein BJ875DRAFT_439081 [Amylocarpus encephaloides]
MDLAVEIRMTLYEDLLIFPQHFVVSLFGEPSEPMPASHCPAIHLLQTCKLVNEEATPVFYSNHFFFSLPPSRLPRIDSSCYEAHSMGPAFQLSRFRWSTIACINSLSYPSGLNVTHVSSLTSPAFTVTGEDIVDLLWPTDVRYSPQGPDLFMSDSFSFWLTLMAMSFQLRERRMELETKIRSLLNKLDPMKHFGLFQYSPAPVPVPQLP